MIRTLLRRDVHSKGVQCVPDVRDSTMNHIGVEARPPSADAGCGSDETDVHRWHVACQASSELRTTCTWTEKNVVRDASSNTQVYIKRLLIIYLLQCY